MSARDSDDDLGQYMPDLKTILRTADPKVAAETRRKALEAPGMAEAIAGLREEEEVTRPVGVGASALVASVASVGIDKAALPVVRDAAETTTPPRQRTRRKGLPLWMTGGAAVLAVAVPVTLTVVLLSRQGPAGGEGVPSATAAAAAVTAAAVGTMSSGAGAVGSTVPVGTQAASAAGAAISSAVVPPVLVASSGAGRPKVIKDGGNPYDAIPPRPAKTVEVVAPPVPTPTVTPAPAPAPAGSSWF